MKGPITGSFTSREIVEFIDISYLAERHMIRGFGEDHEKKALPYIEGVYQFTNRDVIPITLYVILSSFTLIGASCE